MSRERPRDFVEDTVLRYCGPLLFIPSGSQPYRILDNATFGLIDTGQKQLLITCHHVWSHLETLRQEHPDTEAAINLAPGCTITISDADLVDADRHLDIAVLDPKLPPAQLRQLAYFRVRTWPITRMAPKDVIVFAGYPQCQAIVTDTSGTGRTTEFFG